MQVVGHIERDGVRLQKPVIRGQWDAELVADLADGSQRTLFRINPPPAEPNRYTSGLLRKEIAKDTG